MLTNQEIVEDLVANFGKDVTEFDEPSGLLTFTTTREQIIPLLTYLNKHDKFRFRFLTDITAIHFPDSEGKEFAVVYHVHSLENGIRIRIKVYLSKNDIHIPTAVNLYVGANWMEREAFDFFGVIFDGHPNLQRILNMDDMDYHPMRKEYALEDSTRQDKLDALFGR